MPARTSIIIVSFNNFSGTTGPCLQSLAADPELGQMEVIVVDNASSDGTGSGVCAMKSSLPGLRFIANRTNRGFAGGNNDGVAAAGGDVVILLNSDTIVPPGAMGGLAALLRSHPSWAMLGPVTNQAGNEQKIHTTGAGLLEILAQGAEWCRYGSGGHFPSLRLDFFCVAIRRDVYLELGGLLEDFGAGYYEDTDFSLRANARGHAMVMTEEFFVLHQAGKSFGALGRGRVRSLMRENRKRLAGLYPGGVRLLHLRQCNEQIMKAYCGELRGTREPWARAALAFRFANRMRLAREVLPGSFPKRQWHQLRQYFLGRRFGRALTGE